MIGIADIDAAIDRMGQIVSADPAFLGSFRAKLAEAGVIEAPLRQSDKGPPPMWPSSNEITAIQTAIFDNWPNGKQVKGQPCQFGVTVELWTKPAEKIKISGKRPNIDFKGSMAMLNGTKLKAFIKALRKPRKAPLSEGYLSQLEAIADQLDQNEVVGLVNTNVKDDNEPYERGIFYHDYQMVFLRIENGLPSYAQLVLDQEVLDLAPFDDKDAAGNPHGGRVKFQSRMDLCGFSKVWDTSR